MIDPEVVPDFFDLFRLDGRAFVVVGAGQGVGRQVAHALHQAGARVVCADVDADRAEQVATEVDGHPWVGDATERADVDRLVADAIDLVGDRLHGFVDIIGMARFADVLDLDDDTFDWEIDICLRHAYLCSQAFGRHFVDAGGGGSMVFVSSVSGLSSAPRHGAYGAAKAGLIAWAKTVAEELGPHGIRANTIAPGSMLTPRMIEALAPEQIEGSMAASPLNTLVLPSSIAAAALFLSSDAAAHVTGETLVVDAGVTATFPYSSTP